MAGEREWDDTKVWKQRRIAQAAIHLQEGNKEENRAVWKTSRRLLYYKAA